ncbi:MAG: hypothetical protein ACI97A_003703 [Planctomycetota bacterium]|jgi:hypothetical protein
MISLSGPTRAQRGTSYCVNVSNVTGNISVKAYVGGTVVNVTITQNTVKQTATICLVVPKGASGGVEILATQSGSSDYVSHNALISK